MDETYGSGSTARDAAGLTGLGTGEGAFLLVGLDDGAEKPSSSAGCRLWMGGGTSIEFELGLRLSFGATAAYTASALGGGDRGATPGAGAAVSPPRFGARVA